MNPDPDKRWGVVAGGKPGDKRKPEEIDSDRILYSTLFSRLAGVTQVTTPHEQAIFHTRHTHSLEVAQLALRIAQKLIRDNADRLTGSTMPSLLDYYQV